MPGTSSLLSCNSCSTGGANNNWRRGNCCKCRSRGGEPSGVPAAGCGCSARLQNSTLAPAGHRSTRCNSLLVRSRWWTCLTVKPSLQIWLQQRLRVRSDNGCHHLGVFDQSVVFCSRCQARPWRPTTFRPACAAPRRVSRTAVPQSPCPPSLPTSHSTPVGIINSIDYVWIQLCQLATAPDVTNHILAAEGIEADRRRCVCRCGAASAKGIWGTFSGTARHRPASGAAQTPLCPLPARRLTSPAAAVRRRNFAALVYPAL